MFLYKKRILRLSGVASLIIIASTLASTNATAQSDMKSEFDSFMLYNLDVLDSVAKGLKSQRNLNTSQTAFLYIINDIVTSTAEFDHNKGVTFDKSHIVLWKKWYLWNAGKINAVEFYEAIETLEVFFAKGLVEDERLDRLNKVIKKYRGAAKP